jgi:hypothetical protein
MATNLVQATLSFGTVPSSFCPAGSTAAAQWQSALTMIQGLANITVPVSSGLYVGVNTPPSNLQGQVLWLKTDAYGNPVTPWALFFWNPAVGDWVWPNPRQAGGERIVWDDTELALWQYDGGTLPGVDPTVTAPTVNSGCMWMVNHSRWDFVMPFGAGTNPASYNGQAATIIGQGQTGGEEKHVLTMDEMEHQHALGNVSTYNPPPAGFRQLALETRPSVPLTPNAPGFVSTDWQAEQASGTSAGGTVEDIGSASMEGSPVGIVTDVPVTNDQNHPNPVTGLTPPNPSAHNNMAPYIGVLYGQRSPRVFYSGTGK